MKKKLLPYLYSFPALLVIGLIVLFPILYTGYISLTNMNIYHWFNYSFIGLDNYVKALFVMDSGFIPAVLRTLLWTVINMMLQVVLAFFIALALNAEGLRLKNLYKTLLMFPWAMPGYVSILLWRMGMFNTEFGMLNQWLRTMGFENINWLSGNVMAFTCCTVVNLWLALPFMIMMIDGALQSIDKAYYESATLEGAGFFTRTGKITVPLLRPIVAPAIIMSTFTTFKQFDIIYLLTQQQGAKTGADIHTIITYVYEKAFITNNFGYSSAVSIVIFAMIIVLSIFTRKDLKEEGR
ncbi:carbohydrate ABC transporter permease [Acetanaerobacterium elongatum]|uniref:Carbohydrate ABC transporter membrane protein 1, CUT1 family n=1 Tax=Acetanaerobacterium elongatum TaxID=258515 RepID=A0A1G9W1Q0_9FIRM|nr:sugar ABC transporter permease [Acetanaerobacterium elongatum]SDM78449.1 carbohydrate ABC transporter membrane protein 1, CUT1 family [Acetanaerobacterium elongatum]